MPLSAALNDPKIALNGTPVYPEEESSSMHNIWAVRKLWLGSPCFRCFWDGGKSCALNLRVAIFLHVVSVHKPNAEIPLTKISLSSPWGPARFSWFRGKFMGPTVSILVPLLSKMHRLFGYGGCKEKFNGRPQYFFWAKYAHAASTCLILKSHVGVRLYCISSKFANVAPPISTLFTVAWK